MAIAAITKGEARVDESWDKMDKSVRKKARGSLKVLRKQRNQVAEWYGSLKSSTENAWDHMKKGFSNAYKALNDAWKNPKRQYWHIIEMRKRSTQRWCWNGSEDKTQALIKNLKDYLFTDKSNAHK